MSVVLGLDVAVARGCDAVLLGAARIARPIGQVRSGAEFRALLDDIRPTAVAIDSPPRWATTNGRRACERELTDRGISLFTTPSEEKGRNNSFYEWMEIGFEMFSAAREYKPLETFPYAVAVAIHGNIPGGTKRETRRAALRAVGVDTSGLRNIDQIDAALCAYTAWSWTQGNSTSIGTETEGKITLPGTSLPATYKR